MKHVWRSHGRSLDWLSGCRGVVLAVVFCCSVQNATGWYLPGSAPAEFESGAKVQLKVNSLQSVKTQLPKRFYDLPFCPPETVKASVENIGEVLAGDFIENAPYVVEMKVDRQCAKLCTTKLDKEKKTALARAVEEEYSVHLMADNLPAAMPMMVQGVTAGGPGGTAYILGVPVGRTIEPATDKKTGLHEVYNHLSLMLKHHLHKDSAGRETYRIVGFEVVPKSVSHGGSDTLNCDSGQSAVVENSDSITWTYDVQWEESGIRWATRWDAYFQPGRGENEIHWFSIVNSAMIVLFLTGIVGIILLRTLLRDIARYNQLDNLEEAQEESGWKLVHGDVFRRPQWSRLLAVCAGTGVQILAMTVLTMIFAILGFLSPANRGALLQAMLLVFTFMGFPAGYMAARFAKLFEGVGIDQRPRAQSLQVTFLTAFLYPGVCFSVFFLCNFLLWTQKSTGAVPFGTMFLLLILWFGISVPLVFVGAHFGLKRDVISLPVRTNPIPREIPPHGCLANRFVMTLIAGVLPFGAVFTELLFILTSIWQHQFYYLFGFLALVLSILLVTCAEISIAFTYFQLTGEDYHWWWRSFWCSGTSALYVFLYSMLYFFTRLDITKIVSTVIFFSYTLVLSYTFCLLTGATGFISTFLFMRAIYGSIKVD